MWISLFVGMKISRIFVLYKSGLCPIKQNVMAYKVIELIVPEHEIMEQEHWYYNDRLTKKNATVWMNIVLKDYEIELAPKKYLLRVLNFRDSGSLSSVRDIIRTID